MKKLFTLLLCSGCLLGHQHTQAQCSTGYNTASLNWDYLDYFSYTNAYTAANGYLSSNALSRTQNFAFGTQRVVITHNYADASSLGDNVAHTGEAGSYGAGADVQFIGNGAVTITFDNEVANLKFSVYDADRSQRVAFDARNNANTALPVTLATLGTSILTVSNNGTANARADAAAADVASNLNTAAFNVDVAGPVKTITINVSNTATNGSENGSFWISDISACTAGAFTPNYYAVAQPFTGQPGYLLHAFNKSVYAVDPATGITKLLFTDPYIVLGASSYINSMAYDPVRRILYYVFSLTASPGLNRLLRKYDFNTETISTVLADISSTVYGTGVGIPVVTQASGFSSRGAGVESGGAAFYDGALYLGIETSGKNGSGNPLGNTNREAVIWRIDFDAGNIPYRASQVFALPIDNGAGSLMHDWSDFTINNGVLYDFDGAGANTGSPETDIYHYDMISGAAVNYHLPTGFTPGQPAVSWNGTMYNLFATTLTPTEVPYVALYNGNGTINTAQKFNMTSSPMFTPAIPSLGDAADAFKPKADFGDAPASYDPDALSPAVHEISANLRLGSVEDIEWVKTTSAGADADGGDEDGLPFVQIMNSALGVYYTDVTVYNNTGANATIGGWIDFNNNGTFDAGEGVLRTVATNASAQNIQLVWTGIPQTLAHNSYTYLRIRLTSAVNTLTTAKATGYLPDGEVEDYRVQVNASLLASASILFTAQKISGEKAALNWVAADEPAGMVYQLEKSYNGKDWVALYTAKATATGHTYQYTDAVPNAALVYYRLKCTDARGGVQYSEVKALQFDAVQAVRISPNPARGSAKVYVNAVAAGSAVVQVSDAGGAIVWRQHATLQKGANSVVLNGVQDWPAGMYYVQVSAGGFIHRQKVAVQ